MATHCIDKVRCMESRHGTGRNRRAHLILLLGMAALACALASAYGGRPVGLAAAGALVIHAGLGAGVHLGLAIAGAGLLFAAFRAHRRLRRGGGADTGPGATLHSARFYDWLAQIYSLGREGRLRERTLDVAGLALAEAVLDVGCGTGTLALAARRRVGAAGAVHGVDASAEMIAYARSKSARRGLPVEFQVATAQSLPFPDATFDAVFCTLAMHHLPEDARPGALAEMRRVLKPHGRVLVVEVRRARGVRALLNPATLLHTFRSPRIFDEVEPLMKRAAFERVETGELGLGGLGYVLARGGGNRDA